MTIKDRFRRSLVELAGGEKSEQESFQHFAKCFLEYASATPDNLACIQLLAVNKQSLALKSGEHLSDILNTAEGCAIPEQLKEAYPSLSQQQWDATLRILTVLLTVFDSNKE